MFLTRPSTQAYTMAVEELGVVNKEGAELVEFAKEGKNEGNVP